MSNYVLTQLTVLYPSFSTAYNKIEDALSKYENAEERANNNREGQGMKI